MTDHRHEDVWRLNQELTLLGEELASIKERLTELSHENRRTAITVAELGNKVRDLENRMYEQERR